MPNIIIVEDNQHFSKALTQIISDIPGVELLRIYIDAETAIDEIPAFEPAIVIVDIQLKGKLSGLEIIKQTKSKLPATEFLVCTVNDDSSFVFDALGCGASGYILKNSTASEIKNAILEITNGGAPMSPFIARKVIASFMVARPPVNSLDAILTKREKEVLNLIAQGLLYKEVADTLAISHSTVKKHLKNIYEKLHVQNKIEALNKFRLL